MDSNSPQNPTVQPTSSGETEPCPVFECNLPVDIILTSSDGIHISAHKDNLAQFSSGFPPNVAQGGPGALMVEEQGSLERVSLAENAKVLRLLLHFMHHTHLPDLELDEYRYTFEVIAGVAEAAEKYDVFSAITLCKTFMRTQVKGAWCQADKALDILFYALKHGYTQIANDAADHTKIFSLDEFLIRAQRAGVSHQHMIQWIRYRELHLKQIRDMYKWCDRTDKAYPQHTWNDEHCQQWKDVQYYMISYLTTHLDEIATFRKTASMILAPIGSCEEIFNSPEDFILTCTYCKKRLDEWALYIETRVVREYQFFNLPPLVG